MIERIYVAVIHYGLVYLALQLLHLAWQIGCAIIDSLT